MRFSWGMKIFIYFRCEAGQLVARKLILNLVYNFLHKETLVLSSKYVIINQVIVFKTIQHALLHMHSFKIFRDTR